MQNSSATNFLVIGVMKKATSTLVWALAYSIHDVMRETNQLNGFSNIFYGQIRFLPKRSHFNMFLSKP